MKESRAAAPLAAPHAEEINLPAVRSARAPNVEIENAPDVASGLRSQRLDPALIDRVADDVIRRIDRELRIERERRGL